VLNSLKASNSLYIYDVTIDNEIEKEVLLSLKLDDKNLYQKFILENRALVEGAINQLLKKNFITLNNGDLTINFKARHII
jgi:hypothetical protein